jgi:hypothetical protein
MEIVHKPQKPVEIVVNKQHEYTLKGSMILKRGMKLWECDYSTLKVKEAQLNRRVEMDIYFNINKKADVSVNHNKAYLVALNLKNAKKKFLKHITKILDKRYGKT